MREDATGHVGADSNWQEWETAWRLGWSLGVLICSQAIDPLGAVGLQEPNTDNGDKRDFERRSAKVPCIYIAIRRAVAVDDRDRPIAVACEASRRTTGSNLTGHCARHRAGARHSRRR